MYAALREMREEKRYWADISVNDIGLLQTKENKINSKRTIHYRALVVYTRVRQHMRSGRERKRKRDEDGRSLLSCSRRGGKTEAREGPARSMTKAQSPYSHTMSHTIPLPVKVCAKKQHRSWTECV